MLETARDYVRSEGLIIGRALKGAQILGISSFSELCGEAAVFPET